MTSEKSEEPILFPKWRELVKVASGWEYGSVHTHEEIAGIIQCEYGTPEYYQTVNTAIDKLTHEFQKRLKNVRDEGYRVLNPAEHITEAVWDARRGVKHIYDGIRNLNVAPTRDMSDDEVKRCERTQVYLGRVASAASDGVTQAAQIAGINRNQKMLAKGKEN